LDVLRKRVIRLIDWIFPLRPCRSGIFYWAVELLSRKQKAKSKKQKAIEAIDISEGCNIRLYQSLQ
jgi:hypothetical protein